MVTLEDFRVAQADELVAMWRKSFEHGVGVTDPHPVEQQRNFLLTKLLPENTLRVALDNGRIVGFVAANTGSVAQLYVCVDHLRCGIGTLMLDWAKAQSGGSLWLHTFERNTDAQVFYEKSGFSVIDRGFEEFWQLEDIKYTWSRDSDPNSFTIP